MRKSRFSEEKMVSILREADREPVGEMAKRHGISEQTIYNRRRHFGSMDTADVKKLREFEQENARLKKMLANRRSSSPLPTALRARRDCAASRRDVAPRPSIGAWTDRIGGG